MRSAVGAKGLYLLRLDRLDLAERSFFCLLDRDRLQAHQGRATLWLPWITVHTCVAKQSAAVLCIAVPAMGAVRPPAVRTRSGPQMAWTTELPANIEISAMTAGSTGSTDSSRISPRWDTAHIKCVTCLRGRLSLTRALDTVWNASHLTLSTRVCCVARGARG